MLGTYRVLSKNVVQERRRPPVLSFSRGNDVQNYPVRRSRAPIMFRRSTQLKSLFLAKSHIIAGDTLTSTQPKTFISQGLLYLYIFSKDSDMNILSCDSGRRQSTLMSVPDIRPSCIRHHGLEIGDTSPVLLRRLAFRSHCHKERAHVFNEAMARSRVREKRCTESASSFSFTVSCSLLYSLRFSKRLGIL